MADRAWAHLHLHNAPVIYLGKTPAFPDFDRASCYLSRLTRAEKYRSDVFNWFAE